jgi:Ca2+-binding RTX toxin-like protein
MKKLLFGLLISIDGNDTLDGGEGEDVLIYPDESGTLTVEGDLGGFIGGLLEP